jgi:uncharacterized protein (TIGR00251 family)
VDGGSELLLFAKPRASRSEILSIRITGQSAALEVRLAAPPAQGAANLELLELLAGALRIPLGHLELVRGASGRHKRVRIQGLAPQDILSRLS